MSAVQIKEIIYKQFGNCIEISNGVIDIVVTVDHGPRIIRIGFIGGENEFCENNDATLATYGDKEWKIRGGHRLWHSPEYFPRTYIADNEPVEWETTEKGVKLVQKVEPWVQIKKEMEIELSVDSNRVVVTHHLTNKNAWPVELAAWALSVMATGGMEIIPQPSRDTGFLGNRLVALWPFTKMNDHRIYWGDKYIVLSQDPKMKPPFKLGIPNEDGWAAYFNHGNLFIKRFNHMIGNKYPDFGVSFETYTTDFMLEMESLSPLTLLEPESTLTHVEEWELIQNVDRPSNEESSIDAIVKQYIVK